MSGGSLDYFCYRLEEHAEDLGDAELNDLVKDLAKLFHDREWYLSGDTCLGHWREARDKFKAKWFTVEGRQDRIETYLANMGEEVRQMLGLSNRMCRYCKHFTARKKPDYDEYGDCEYQTACLTHRSESCEKWEESK